MGLPRGASVLSNGAAFIESEGKAVNGIVLLGRFLCANVELVVVKENGDGLDLSEVPSQVGASLFDEVGDDVEVGVGDEAKVSVFLTMEIESDAIAAHEPRVLAHCSWYGTICN